MQVSSAMSRPATEKPEPTADNALLAMAFAKPADVFNLPAEAQAAPAYGAAQPYGHLMIDGFFKPDVFAAIQCELVGGAAEFKKVFIDELQTRKTISTGDAVPAYISLIAAKFAAPEMLRYLERITGLKRLIPDPYYNTDYGYYHIVSPGGVLASHVDHSRHSSLSVPHVLNLVVYLSDGWDPADGGALCLYDAAGKEIRQRFTCDGNRGIVFACNPAAYHGVEPIREGGAKRRHSLYFAYYSVEGADAAAPEYFVGGGSGASNLDARTNYGTYFVVPFWQLLKPRNWIHLRTRLIYLANLLLPPILMEAVRRVVRFLR